MGAGSGVILIPASCMGPMMVGFYVNTLNYLRDSTLVESGLEFFVGPLKSIT